MTNTYYYSFSNTHTTHIRCMWTMIVITVIISVRVDNLCSYIYVYKCRNIPTLHCCKCNYVLLFRMISSDCWRAICGSLDLARSHSLQCGEDECVCVFFSIFVLHMTLFLCIWWCVTAEFLGVVMGNTAALLSNVSGKGKPMSLNTLCFTVIFSAIATSKRMNTFVRYKVW